jgi:hypothetical protein
MMNTNTGVQNTTAGGRKSRNRLVVPQAESFVDQLKFEIAQEMGVQLGSDTSARDNGRVGGMLTKRLIALGEAYLAEQGMQQQQAQQSAIHMQPTQYLPQTDQQVILQHAQQLEEGQQLH